jgi:lipopolysaccharide heptosyltransferase II
MGDFIMTTPLFPALRQAFPEARIDLVCQKSIQSLAALFERELDEIIPVDAGWDRPSELRTLLTGLRRHRYDLVADLRGDYRYTIFAYLTGASRRYGYANAGFDFLLTHPQPSYPSHQVEEVAEMAAALGAPLLSPELGLPLRAEHRDFAGEWLAENGIRLREPLIAMHLTQRVRPAKLWTQDRFAEVANRLQSECGARILILGGKEEREEAEAFARALAAPPVLAVGETNPVETAALLERCRLFLGIDSGVAHLAAAVRCPTLVLFGSTDPARYRPWGAHCRVLQASRVCDRRCDQKTCAVPQDHCMLSISPEAVFTAAVEMLTRYSPPQFSPPEESTLPCA